ncbi:hypothetical protein ABJI51_40435 [Amycolatopsis sp. NEAU-NG30]|uniref:Lipoprotein n=1 Tax=Amycolatopsis melonis TaxID=3156488 RepID=A0ABV0LSU2_9PSEU
MRTVSRALTLCGAGLLLASCGVFAPGDAETDRQSTTLADAISYPQQPDATGLARAALATTLGRSSNFSVLEARDLEHSDAKDPFAHLVWRIHRPESTGWGTTPAFDACYAVEFNYYGTTSLERTTCPADAVPITPPPLPRADIPPDFEPALKALLGKLPPAPVDADVRTALATGLPAPRVDPETHLAAIPPETAFQIKGTDVGVVVFTRGGDCMMGHRLHGTVKVWSLNWRDHIQEKPCGAEAALSTP